MLPDLDVKVVIITHHVRRIINLLCLFLLSAVGFWKSADVDVLNLAVLVVQIYVSSSMDKRRHQNASTPSVYDHAKRLESSVIQQP